jgi:hypothetical protein
MMNWESVENAPRDGTPVLLWARLKSSPPEDNDRYPIVGFWHQSVEQWKVQPEHLNQEEELIPDYWSALPEPPPS